jgi:hypothetical protein
VLGGAALETASSPTSRSTSTRTVQIQCSGGSAAGLDYEDIDLTAIAVGELA